MDCRLPGSSIHGILQARVLEWVAIFFSITNPAATAKSLQSCLTLCDPIDSSPPGSPVPGILQARTLEWVAVSFSNAGKWKMKVKSLSRVGLLATPWTTAYQAPPSTGFSRQEYWSGVPLPSLSSVLLDCNFICFCGIFLILISRWWWHLDCVWKCFSHCNFLKWFQKYRC